MAAGISVHKALAATVRRSGLFLCGMSLAAAAAADPGSPAQTVTAALRSPQAATSKAAPSQAVAPGKTPQGIAPEAWSRIMAEVRARTYAMRSGSGGSLLAANPAQHLDARFTPRGVVITPQQNIGSALHARATAASGAPFQLRTRSIDGKPAAAISPVAAANRVEYRGPGYTEWYVNDAKGMEQGWTLAAPAAGGRSPLIRIGVTGARTVVEDAGAIRIEDHQGKLRYRYAGLKVTDAGQRMLPAQLRLARPGLIEIAVDDHGAQYPLTVDPSITVTQAVTLSDPAATGNDQFGSAVAVTGDTVVVGAYANKGGLYQGAAYIYSRNQGGIGAWGLAASLSDPAASNGDNFGVSVAVDGDTVVVGAQGGSSAQGKAYIYSRNQGGAGVWGLAATLSDPPASNGAQFGGAVAVNGDTVVVGAYTAGTGGAAYVYSRGASGAGSGSGVWSLAASLADPAAVSGDEFGSAVAVYGDIAVVGAYGTSGSKGAAYIYSRNQGGAGSWGLADSLSDPAAAGNDFFGYAVSLNGDTVVVGAYGTSGSKGAAYIYSRTPTSSGSGDGSGVWALAASLGDPLATAGDFFGRAVAVYGDLVLAGAPDTSANQGAAYLFSRNQGGSGRWGQAATLNIPAGAANFGYAVALGGGTLVTGAYGSSTDQGKTYIFDIGGGNFEEAVNLSNPADYADGAGYAVAVEGDTVAVGAPDTASNQGVTYIYGRNQSGPGSWGLIATLSNPTALKNYFGYSVAANGDIVVVGAPNPFDGVGAAYIYLRNQGGTDSWGLAATLTDPGASNDDVFGNSVAVNGDTAIVGAPDSSVGPGKTYLYNRNQNGAGAWGLAATLIDPGASKSDDFGFAVGLNGDTAVVGACGADTGEGAAYIYSRNQGGAGEWGLAATLSDPAATENDQFGYSIGLDGDTVVVGAPLTSGNLGAAYIYSRNLGGTGLWGLASTLSDPAATSNGFFGTSAAVNGDTVAVGGTGVNTVYIYSRNQGGTGVWGQAAILTDPAAISRDEFSNVAVYGQTIVVGAEATDNRGAAYVYSLVTVAPPTTPANLVATGGNGQVTLSWTPSTGQTDYYVFVGTTPGGESGKGIWSGGSPATISGLSNGTQYYFYVKAYNHATAESSPPSNQASATPLSPPTAPTSLVAVAGNEQVTLTWTASTGETDYYVFEGTTSGGESSKGIWSGGSSTTITGLSNGTPYYFYVKAYNHASGESSAPSNQVSATPN